MVLSLDCFFISDASNDNADGPLRFALGRGGYRRYGRGTCCLVFFGPSDGISCTGRPRIRQMVISAKSSWLFLTNFLAQVYPSIPSHAFPVLKKKKPPKKARQQPTPSASSSSKPAKAASSSSSKKAATTRKSSKKSAASPEATTF